VTVRTLGENIVMRAHSSTNDVILPLDKPVMHEGASPCCAATSRPMCVRDQARGRSEARLHRPCGKAVFFES